MARARVALAPRRPSPAGCRLLAGNNTDAYHVWEPRGQEGKASRQEGWSLPPGYRTLYKQTQRLGGRRGG